MWQRLSAEILWPWLRQHSEYPHVETKLINFETANKRTVLADIIINVYEIGRIKFEMDINIEINEYLILIIKNYISHRRRKYSCRRLMCSMS